MLSKETLTKRLEDFKSKASFASFKNNNKFYEFISINFEMDKFFVLNLLEKNEILKVLEDKDLIVKLNQTLGEIIEENLEV